MSDSNVTELNVKKFEPRGLEAPKDENRITIKPYSPSKIGEGHMKSYTEKKQIFGSLASTDEDNVNPRFALHPDSKKYLGVEQEEQSHLEAIISKEVEDRVNKIQDSAYAEGFEKGVREGKVEAENKLTDKIKPKWEQLEVMLNSFDGMKKEMYEANEKILIQMIYNISKQIMLKELKVDREYLKRLCVQMIEKMGIRDHLKIKVSKLDHEGMDELKEFLKVQYSDLKNLQIETSDEVQLGGCKVETNLIWINASLESQLKAIEESLKET